MANVNNSDYTLFTSQTDLQLFLSQQKFCYPTVADEEPKEFPCLGQVVDITFRQDVNGPFYKLILDYIYPDDVRPLLAEMMKNGIDRIFNSKSELTI